MDAVDICSIAFELDGVPRVSPAQLRGCMAHRFADIPEFHHHSDRSYHYPLVQYKVLDGRSAVVGVREYADMVGGMVTDTTNLAIGSSAYAVRSMSLERKKYLFGYEDGTYRFATPWLALNADNHRRFLALDATGRLKLLGRVLTGNILSMLKGVGVHADRHITTDVAAFETESVQMHGSRFIGIRAQFRSDASLPPWLGLGKSVSKGFGVVERVA